MSKILNKGIRFELRLGKFGTFFYDKKNDKILNNNDVLNLLELIER